MRTFLKEIALILVLSLVLGMAPAAAAEDTLPELSDSGSLDLEKPSEEALREQFAAMPEPQGSMLEVPSTVSPYTLGKISPGYILSGLDLMNLYRTIAGLPSVQTTDELNLSAQYGAVLLGAVDQLSHTPAQPADMDDEFYQAGYEATSSSNICYFSSSSSLKNTLQRSVQAYMDDYSPGNAVRVGHRRWILSPRLLYTGFGAAISSTDKVYTTNKVFDKSGPEVNYNYIAWPASGNTPFGLFPLVDPWSVSLNPKRYSTPEREDLTITLTRLEDGVSWSFDSASAEAPATEYDPFFCVETSGYGEGPAIIFRPELDRSMYLGEYEVTIRGLKDLNGANADLRYRVNFFDIRTQLPNDINNAQVRVISGSWLLDPSTLNASYNGGEPIVFDDRILVRDSEGNTLVKGVDYTITYRDNINAGTGYLILTGIGSWYGVREFPFTIRKAEVTLRLVYYTPYVGYDVRVGNTIQTRIDDLSPTDSTHFTYVSEDPSIATVDENGRVTGVSPGEVLIWVHTEETANYKSGSGWTSISVIDKEVPVYRFDEDPLYKKYGDKPFYHCAGQVGVQSSGTVLDYESSDPQVATVDDMGKVTITGVGEATITLYTSEDQTYKAGEFSYRLIVEKGDQKVKASLSDDSVKPGETAVITATATEGTLSYVSDAPEVATVDENGVITGVGPGTAVITVTADATDHYNSASAQVTIHVEEPDPVIIEPTHITITSGREYRMKVEEFIYLTAQVYPENAGNQEFSWSSDNQRVANVNQQGRVIAYEEGTANITVTTWNGKTDSVVVHVEHVHSPETDPAEEPGCTRPGKTEGSHCRDCGEVLAAQETIPALGHSFGEYVSNGDANCISQGTKTAHCVRCGQADTIPGDGGYGDHKFGDWITAVEPTETEEGLEWTECIYCDVIQTRRIPATGGGTVNPFTDVPEDSFYYEPVLWALKEGITSGTSATTFDPTGACLRAQVVTFLWRAEGCPEPTAEKNPFVDVKPTDFYYTAVLWAVEKGITTGTDANHFSPMGVCNRAQVVTFLHRTFGSPAVEGADNPFTDVPAGTWYTVPVLWAVEQGITNGLSAAEFGPVTSCNRAQIVTFLYRAYHG